VAKEADEEDAEIEALARAVLALGPRVVVLTGGHRVRAADLFIDSQDGDVVLIEGERHPDGAAHGSGCTHSSLLAAQLALGHTPLEAARSARALTGEAVAGGLRDVGVGVGPVDVIGLATLRGS
jgi:hydroxymethylpyrimidine/phosphomethylpyrimidine kinase